MGETDIEVTGAAGRLAGTLLRPAVDSAGLVIFVHGSGPMDRDQNAGPQKLNIFNDLARDLAAGGFASIRYDKRGVGASGGDFERISYDDLVADLAVWLDHAVGLGLGPVFLCGHSEGTLIAAKLAGDRGGDVAGVIEICPFVTPGQEILRAQAREGARMVAEMPGFGGWLTRAVSRLTGGSVRTQEKIMSRVLSSDLAVMRIMGRKQGVRWLRDFMRWDFAAIHAGNTRPVLLIVAGKDVQAPPEDGAAIVALAGGGAELVVFDDMSHVLRRSGEAAGFEHYAEELKAPMDPVVAATMLDWLARQG